MRFPPPAREAFGTRPPATGRPVLAPFRPSEIAGDGGVTAKLPRCRLSRWRRRQRWCRGASSWTLRCQWRRMQQRLRRRWERRVRPWPFSPRLWCLREVQQLLWRWQWSWVQHRQGERSSPKPEQQHPVGVPAVASPGTPVASPLRGAGHRLAETAARCRALFLRGARGSEGRMRLRSIKGVFKYLCWLDTTSCRLRLLV